MRLLCLALTFASLAACVAPTVPPALRAQITAQDMLMNRPDTDRQDARFRMMPDGSGTVAFLSSASGPQPVAWSLTGARFCIEADEGLIASFGCAALDITGGQITLAHTGSDSVARGVLVPRD